MRPLSRPLARLLALAVAALLLLGIAGEDGRETHTDAVPTTRPPGFEPVDISEEMEQVRARRTREMQRQVDADIHYRTISSEPRLRARYGGATWNLYEPYH